MLTWLVRYSLWVCVHFVWSVALLVRHSWRRCVAALRKRRSEDIRAPAHVAVVLAAPTAPGSKPHLENLARLIVWSLSAGASHFTVYDPTGSLKRIEDELLSIVEKTKTNFPGEIKWANGPTISGYKNGSNRKMIVNIFSKSDGKQKIVAAVKESCFKNRINGSVLNSVTVDSVDNILNDAYSYLPEPNLAIYFGELCCTHGMLPWHIRLTEFFNIERIETLKFEDFIEVLRKYRKCEQRFGK